jgi:hypothetical protein
LGRIEKKALHPTHPHQWGEGRRRVVMNECSRVHVFTPWVVLDRRTVLDKRTVTRFTLYVYPVLYVYPARFGVKGVISKIDGDIKSFEYTPGSECVLIQTWPEK